MIYKIYTSKIENMASIKQIDGYKIFMNKMIGKGSFGAVYEGVSDRTGEKVAVKILAKSSSTNLNNIKLTQMNI